MIKLVLFENKAIHLSQIPACNFPIIKMRQRTLFATQAKLLASKYMKKGKLNKVWWRKKILCYKNTYNITIIGFYVIFSEDVEFTRHQYYILNQTVYEDESVLVIPAPSKRDRLRVQVLVQSYFWAPGWLTSRLGRNICAGCILFRHCLSWHNWLDSFSICWVLLMEIGG